MIVDPDVEKAIRNGVYDAYRQGIAAAIGVLLDATRAPWTEPQRDAICWCISQLRLLSLKALEVQ